MTGTDAYDEALERQRQSMLEKLDRVEKLSLAAIAERDKLLAELAEARFDADRYKQDHLNACKTIAQMHEAATGRFGEGPVRGVVEDVADLKTAYDELLAKTQSSLPR